MSATDQDKKSTDSQRMEFDMTQIRERDQCPYDAADNAFTSKGGFVAPATEVSQCAGLLPSMLALPHQAELAAHGARRRIMDEAAVTSDGRDYYYDGHRYSGLLEAVDQSNLMRSRPTRDHPPGPFTKTPAVVAPTAADLALMSLLGIRFVAGRYCFEIYRYDHLEDALGYARLCRTKTAVSTA